MTLGALVEADAQFSALMEKISRERGFGCASYKEKCLRRRIAVRMRATGVHSYDAYASKLDHDEHEYDLLLDALTINVTKLFRNWDAFDKVARNQQQRGLGLHGIELIDDRIEPPHIQLMRVAAIEADMDVAQLGNQYAVDRDVPGQSPTPRRSM